MTPEALKALRNKLGLSVAEAAAQVHVSVRSWNRWESGERHIPETAVHLFHVQNGLKYPGK